MSPGARPSIPIASGTAAAPSSSTTDHGHGYKLLFAHAEMLGKDLKAAQQSALLRQHGFHTAVARE
jgi:hypothetical protein